MYDDVSCYYPNTNVGGDNNVISTTSGGNEVIHQMAPVPLPRKFETAPPYRDPPPVTHRPVDAPPPSAHRSVEAPPVPATTTQTSVVAPPTQSQETVAEQVATCRRRRRSRQKSLPMAGELDVNTIELQQQHIQQLQQAVTDYTASIGMDQYK